MSEETAAVPKPALAIRDGTPVSQAFDDVYFSRAGGIAETEHVFLKGNGLPERWRGRQRFTIAEFGFGTGLNFLVALKAFRATADAGAVLHYLSVEKYPFVVEDLRDLLALQPEVAAEAAELVGQYPLRLPGIHRIHLPCCVLTLCIGDIAEMLPQITTSIDAWFLDGFSPAKNGDMWQAALLAQVGQLSVADATFATFTAAGDVKRGLMAAGFTVEKAPGFGHKRDMLVGRQPVVDADAAADVSPATTHACTNHKHIVVIGAGIAGASLARALADRGHAVTVLERDHVANGASGNGAGVLFPQLSKRWNRSTAWYFTAYQFMLQQLQHWQQDGLQFTHASPGMLRVPRHAEEEQQLRMLNETLGLDSCIVRWMERDEASAQAGIPLPYGAAFFPQGSWVNPPSLCAALLQHEAIMLREHCRVHSIAREGEAWRVSLENGEIMQADAVCVAAAQDSTQLLEDYGVSVNMVGGQLSEIAAADVAAPLRSILCHKGYVVPLGERYLIGATYHREALHDVTSERHAENIAELQHVLPGWFTGEATAGRSSVRATTPDRMPYAGQLDAGLYVSTGHGSRGLLSAPLAAEMIASSISHEQSPVTESLRAAVNPLRFLNRRS